MKITSSARIPLFLSSLALLCAFGCGGAANGALRVTASSGAPSGPSGVTGISFFNSSNPATNPYPQSIAVADFNGDGKLDMAVSVYSIFTSFSDVNILLGNGDGTFTAGPAFPLTGQNVNNAVVADFNGDGKPDLAISLPDANQVQVLLGNGDGTFTALPAISATGVFKVATEDFNGDGKPDLVLVNPGPGTVTILLGNGDGTFPRKETIPVAGGPQAVAVGDFNRDGKADLAVVNYSADTVTILLGNGDGTFRAVPSKPATGIQPLSVAVGDFNGDGIPDLAVTNQNNGYPLLGTVTMLIGRGNGTFMEASLRRRVPPWVKILSSPPWRISTAMACPIWPPRAIPQVR